MQRRNGMRISPRLRVDRGELAGALLATAGDAGWVVCESRKQSRASIGEVIVHELACEAQGYAPTGMLLGFALECGGCSVTIAFLAHGKLALRLVRHVEMPTPDALEIVEQLSTTFYRQLVLRRVVMTLRRHEFMIVERPTESASCATLRARMPSAHHLRSSARTAPPDFSMEFESDGSVTATMRRLQPKNRRTVENVLCTALVEFDGTTKPVVIAGESGAAPSMSATRRARRVHAA